mgnify:CR=1 FL=1
MNMEDQQRDENMIRGDVTIQKDKKLYNGAKNRSCRSREDELFLTGLISLAAGAALWALYYLWLRRFIPRIPCFFSNVLGIYCPGCGGTRAVYALLHGRLLKAVWCHPLVPYGAVIYGGFMLTQGLHRLGVKCIKPWKFHNWYLYGAMAILVCNFLVKNLLRLVWGVTI